MKSSRALLEALHASGRGLPLWMAFQALAAAAVVAWFLARSRGPFSRLRLCLLLSFAGALVGSAALGVLFRLPSWLRFHGSESALSGGVVAHGALAGLALAFALLARFRGFQRAEALDRLAPCLGAMVVFGRLGCFFAGCDFGTVTSAAWAVRFPPGSPAFLDHAARGWILASDHRSLPVHPTQLYEVALGVVSSLVALLVERRPHRPGAVMRAAIATYATGRIAIDGWRGDTASQTWGPWTPNQWWSACLVVGVVLWAVQSARSPSRDRASGALTPSVPERSSGPPSPVLSPPEP